MTSGTPAVPVFFLAIIIAILHKDDLLVPRVKLTFGRRLPCQEEAVTDELLVVACVRLAILCQHRHDSRTAAVQEVSPVVGLAVTPPSDASERAVAASRLHKPLVRRRCRRRRRRLGAVVQDHFLIDRADGERKGDLSGAVVFGDSAALIDDGAVRVGGSDELFELVGVGHDQGGVVVEDGEDLEPVLVPAVSEERRGVDAANLEPDRAAVGARRLLLDDPEREDDAHVAAEHRRTVSC